MMKRPKVGETTTTVIDDDVVVRNTTVSSYAVPKPAFVGVVQPITTTTTTLHQVVLQRPIAKRASERFYAATEHANIPFMTVHTAVQETHDWETTWVTRIGDTNPLVAKDDATAIVPTANIPDHQHTDDASTDSDSDDDDDVGLFGGDAAAIAAAIMESDRYCGARNPSPTQYNNNQQQHQKRTISHVVMDNHNGHQEQGLYPFTTYTANINNYSQQQQQLTSPIKLFKPIAMRVDAVIEPQLPKVVVPPQTQLQQSQQQKGTNNSNPVWIIPTEITRLRSGNNENMDDNTRSLSPITTSDTSTILHSTTSSQRSSNMHNTQAVTRVFNIIEEDGDEEYCVTFPPRMMIAPKAETARVIEARENLLYQLAISGGDTSSTEFDNALQILIDNYNHTKTMNQNKVPYYDTYYNNNGTVATNNNIQSPYTEHEGTWLTLTKPTFFGCLGENDAGDPLYTLGRMTFDMFTPNDLVCSLQGNFNTVHNVTEVPECLIPHVGTDPSVLRTYNIITAFTIEPSLAAYPDAPNKTVHKKIRGLLTTTGYMMADPATATTTSAAVDESLTEDLQDDATTTSPPQERNSLWITGGTIAPNDTEHDRAAWKTLFGAVPPRTMVANAKLLAMKWLLGAEVDDNMDPTTGTLQYTFTKPIGGHGKAYSDTLYTDSSLRIIRGHRGTLFVFSKQPDCK